jgi:hypothetical protein
MSVAANMAEVDRRDTVRAPRVFFSPMSPITTVARTLGPGVLLIAAVSAVLLYSDRESFRT